MIVGLKNMNNIFKEKYPLLDSSFGFQGNNWGESYSPSEAKELFEKYASFIASKKSILETIELYFGSRLHDSQVEYIEYRENKLAITLNEFASHCFADALDETYSLGVPHKKRVFPVSICFSGIERCTISWINKNSKILPLNKEKYFPKLSELLSDQIIAFSDKFIEVGFLFWTMHGGNKSNLLLEIKAQKLEIFEHQRNAFEKLYSGRYLDIFDYFWQEKRKGKYFDYSVAKQLINERT